mmetsp:Transcript_73303/g.137002  ORF Transcript_73303/g.137002 Transcript_73303/m.137002 type:complete len:268 (-) Transcript_73303:13-816(-)
MPCHGQPREWCMREDRQALLKKVAQGDLDAFYDAAPVLQADREIILAAVSWEGHALACAADNLRRDREVVLAAVSSDGDALALVAEELRNDKEIIMAAVLQTGGALEHVSAKLAGDREIVAAAISESGWALSFASEELRSDRDLVLAATARDPEALQVAGQVLLKDTSFAVAARQTVYFFKVSLLSGRSCIIAADNDEECSEPGLSALSQLLVDSCARLGIERNGCELLVHGLQIVPEGASMCDWPGSPSKGTVTEYQLIVRNGPGA